MAALSLSFSLLQRSPGRAPQKLQDSPSGFKNGLLLAHVPENSPSFFTKILMAIPAKAKANNPIATSTPVQFMVQIYQIKRFDTALLFVSLSYD